MSHSPEIARLVGKEITPNTVESILGRIFPSGHAIHGFSSSGNIRVMMILESSQYSDSAPLLGYGMDGSAERALVRALATYVKREQQGLDSIKANQFPESTEGRISTSRHPSRFDNIVWSGDFKMYQTGRSVIAASTFGGGDWGRSPLEVKAPTPLGAITRLADEYRFHGSYEPTNERLRNLPAISLE
jgi:hypothetical protein